MQPVQDRLYQRGNTSITVIIVMTVGVILALILGVQLGSGDYRAASTWLLIGICVLYITHLHHYTWQLVILSVFLGFVYQPLGFKVESQHIGLLLGGLLALLYLLAPITYRPENYLSGSGAKGMKICLAIWVLYGVVHLIWNHIDPFMPSQYAFKNALKTYVEAFGGPAIILWFMVKPSGFRVGKDWTKTIVILLFIGMSVNMFVQIYYIAKGFGVVDPNAAPAGTRQHVSPLMIPVINLSPNPHGLRFLCPLAVALGLIFWTSPSWFKKQSGWIKTLVISVVLMGLIGAGLSSGRGVMLLSGFYVFIIALLRRRMILILAVGTMGVLFIGVVNIFANQINENAPYFMQRSLQYFMLEKGSAAVSIKSSSDWRDELARRAYNEWRSDPRIFLTGRATYSFSDTDIMIYDQIGHYEAIMEISLRRGQAHRLLADCLIQYGIVGLILFYIMMISILRFLVKLYRSQKQEDTIFRDLTFVLIVSFSVSLVLTFIVTQWLLVYNVWLLLLLIVGYSQEVRARTMRKEEESISRRGVTQFSEQVRV